MSAAKESLPQFPDLALDDLYDDISRAMRTMLGILAGSLVISASFLMLF